MEQVRHGFHALDLAHGRGPLRALQAPVGSSTQSLGNTDFRALVGSVRTPRLQDNAVGKRSDVAILQLTCVAPSWDCIGKLAAIAVIRTTLNYFLSEEMQEEQRLVENGNRETVARGET